MFSGRGSAVVTTQPQETDETGDDVASGSLADDASFARPDFELETLVDIANRVGVGVNVTLMTSGGVISGTLMAHSQFWDETADTIEKFAPDGEAEAPAAARHALASGYRKIATEARAELETEDHWPPRYVHLQNATFHDGARYVTVPIWRGRLATVVGWSFGATA